MKVVKNPEGETTKMQNIEIKAESVNYAQKKLMRRQLYVQW